MRNPVDDVAFTRPLVKALRAHVEAVASSLAGDIPDGTDYAAAHSVRHRIASAWVYTSCLVAWAEDHGLVPTWLRADAEAARKEYLTQPGTDMRQWLAHAYASLTVHPATACLLDPRYSAIGEATPSEGAVRDLVDWWSADAPDLAYEHTGPGPASITGWLVGDLLQALEDEGRTASAFCQTPWFVADFLCARTLVPAAADFSGETLRVIDPAAGTGHILVWVMQGLYHLYTAGVPGWPPLRPADAIARVLAGLHGVELHPVTAAVARLRLTVLAGALLHGAGAIPGPLRLADIPATVRPRIAVGNALLAGQGDPNPPGTILDDTTDYPGILDRGTYHAVIANPPYKVEKDPVVREAIRQAYHEVCHRQFPLSVPFTKLLFDLALPNSPAPVQQQLELELFAAAATA